MARGERAGVEQLLHALRKLEQADGVRHSGPVTPDRLSDIAVRQAELAHEPLVALRLIDGGEGSALQVLHQREREQGPLVHLTHDRRDPLPPELSDRTPTPFAGHQLVPVSGLADDDGLNQTGRGDGLLELLERLGVEGPAGLEPIGLDLAHGELAQRAVALRVFDRRNA